MNCGCQLGHEILRSSSMPATYATYYVLKNEIDHFEVLAEWAIDEKKMINFVLTQGKTCQSFGNWTIGNFFWQLH